MPRGGGGGTLFKTQQNPKTGTDSPYVFTSPGRAPGEDALVFTYSNDGYAKSNLGINRGMRTTVPVKVDRKIKLGMRFDEIVSFGSYAAGFMSAGEGIDLDWPLGIGYKFSIGNYLTGVQPIVDNPNNYPPLQWAGDRNANSNTSRILCTQNNMTHGFHAGASNNAGIKYQALLDALNFDATGSRQIGAQYEMIFDIQTTASDTDDMKDTVTPAPAANKRAQSAVASSNLTINIIYADKTTKTVNVPMSITRGAFSAGEAYFWINNGDDNGGTRSIKLANEYILTDGTSSATTLSDVKVNGVATDITSAVKVFGSDLVSFKVVSDVETSPTVKVGGKLVTADSQGVYATTMPHADGEITVEYDGAVYHNVEFDLKGGSGSVKSQPIKDGEKATRPAVEPTKSGYFFKDWYTDAACTTKFDFANTVITGATTIHAGYNETVVITYSIKGFKSKTSEVIKNSKATLYTLADFHSQSTNVAYEGFLNVDSLQLKWYSDSKMTTEFNFDSNVAATCTVYGKLTETKTYGNPDAHGWDEPVSDKDSSGNKFLDVNCIMTPSIQGTDGISTFNLPDATRTAIYSRKLDVTKPIYMNINLNTEISTWFNVGLFDKLTLAQLAYSSAYNGEAGALASWLWDLKTGAVHTGLITDWELDSAYGHSEDWNVEAKIIIDKDPAKSVMMFGDTVASYLKVGQDDFDGGYAYMSFGTFATVMMDAMVYQDIDTTVGTVENGTVTVSREGGAVMVTATAAEGYELDTIYANGEIVEYEAVEEGNVYFIRFDKYEDLVFTADFVKKEIEKPGDGDNNGGGDNPPAQEDKGCNSQVDASASFVVIAVILGLSIILIIRKSKKQKI